MSNNSRKTKIVCTMGPASLKEPVLEKMFKAGMNVARFNFSHGTHEYHKEGIELVRRVRDRLKLPAAILLDTKGPEIRTGVLECGKIVIEKGQKFTLTTVQGVGNAEAVSITYEKLPKELKVGDRVLIDDGRIDLRVEELTDTDIICNVVVGGELSSRKGINIPNAHLSKWMLISLRQVL